MKKLQLLGQRFGVLVAIAELLPRKGSTMWLCICDCGQHSVIHGKRLVYGVVRSCGCRKYGPYARTHGLHSNRILYPMWAGAKYRAKKRGLEFDLDITEIILPMVCPLLDIPLFQGSGKQCDNSPTLDRKNPLKGYTKDNVWVISYKANRLKSTLTFPELQALSRNLSVLVTIP